jgi:DNA-binding transcriptional MerR regulator
MTRESTLLYGSAEFAALAGVTVRALRHYERLGLLRPRRSPAGYRTYSSGDLAELEQIIALKSIGVPLKRIAMVRCANAEVLATALRDQRVILQEKRAALSRAIDAIGEAESALRSGRLPGAPLFKRIIEMMHMHNDGEAWQETYDRLMALWTERRKQISSDEMVAIGAQWETLAGDLMNAADEDPEGANAQRLADRWLAMLDRLYGEEASECMFVTALRDLDQWSPSVASWRGWEVLRKTLNARA